MREAMRTYEPVEDFEVLVPIYGAIRYLENVEFLRPYGERVVLCTTTDETAEFNAGLEQVARENGFRIFRGVVTARRISRQTGDGRHRPRPTRPRRSRRSRSRVRRVHGRRHHVQSTAR